MAIIPPTAPETKVGDVEEWLGVKLVRTTIGGSVVVGALACANSNGMILPSFIRENEVECIKTVFTDGNLSIMDTKRTAYGNIVLTNDYGAIVDPRLKPRVIEKISDTLDVEVFPGEIAGLPYVGSLALATNRGVLVHPMAKEEELKQLREVFKVSVEVGTINCGIPYVSTGLIGNDNNVIAGFLTTGPEMFIIGHALDVVN